jgi:histidinol dehydrogenase
MERRDAAEARDPLMRRLTTADAGFEAAFDVLLADRREMAADVNEAVAAIIADIRARGDTALADHTRRLDRLDLAAVPLRVGADEVAAATATVAPAVLDALRLARDRIAAFHERQRPDAARYTDAAGASLGWRWTPLASVGLYVPGGRAAYPSSLLMNAVPAKVAGVERIAMVVPAPDGVLAPAVLAAAELAGVDEIFRVGGAQAVAALAYGTATIRPVDKIVGPGNAFVAAAKRQVFGTVGIDMVAGPSEVVVVADGGADPALVAADLLAQAEHDEAAKAILLTDDPALAGAVEAEALRQAADLPRRAIVEASLAGHGAIVLLRALTEAAPLVDRLAPEHLQLAVADPEPLAAQIRHAGAIFLGYDTPEAIGDYIAGPNHVLPTSRSARFSSGLSVIDFMKRTTLLGVGRDALERLGPAAMALAAAEGLDAHRLSIARRLER